MNYFYVDNEKYIIGFSNTTIKNLIKTIPEGCPIYYYNAGDDFAEIVATQEPAGIGTGKRIDY